MSYLAKLREFRKGMDVEEYLEGEFRQNLRDLELRMNQVTSVVQGDGLDGQLVFACVDPTTYFEPTGINNPNVNLTANNYLRSGNIINGFYYPAVEGRYMIEHSYRFIDDRAAIGVYVGDVFSIDSNGVLLANNLYNTSTFTLATPHKSMTLTNLSPTLGVRFLITIVGSNQVRLFNINIKITKVG